AAVDPEQKQALCSLDDTLLSSKGVTEPVLEIGGQSRQTARTTFQVVEGITDDILSVNRAVDAGAKVVFHKPRSYIEWADFFRQGNQNVAWAIQKRMGAEKVKVREVRTTDKVAYRILNGVDD
ncbi:unnamed protein product, partial [Symbiodinium pilosum]